MPSLKADLLRLKAGAISFDEFASNRREEYRRWAGYFFERWPQREHDVDDLVQEALVETWRAVDKWEADKGAPIDGYVKMMVGNRLRDVLSRAAHSKCQVVPKYVDHEDCYLEVPAVGSARLEVERAAELLDSELQRDVVVGVGIGMPLREVAARIYDDPDRCERYGFGSPTRCNLITGWAAHKAANEIERRTRWVC